MFGDMEAQRHWMEITTHLPLGDWYESIAAMNAKVSQHHRQ